MLSMDNIRLKIKEYIWLPKICGIYVIKCLCNGKIYIGQAENIKKKIENYMLKIRNGSVSTKHMKGVKEDILKYGYDNFVVDIIAFCAYDNLNFLERYFIRKYQAKEFGYNSINGKRTVNNTKYKFSLEIPEARMEFELNKIITEYRKACGKNEDYKYLVDINNLETILGFNNEVKNIFYEFIERMDFIMYVETNDECYKINGGQFIAFLFNEHCFKYDNAYIKKEDVVPNRLEIRNIYVQCPYLKEFEYFLLLESDYIIKNKCIDFTYRRYKFIENISVIKIKK